MGFTAMLHASPAPWDVTGVANTTEVIKGVDGNDIILFISTLLSPYADDYLVLSGHAGIAPVGQNVSLQMFALNALGL